MELSCILERHGSLARETYPKVRVARSLDELLSDQTIQLCVVATRTTPTSIWRSMSAGRPGCCRRQAADPDAIPSAGANPTRRRARTLLTVYQDRRYDGEFRTLTKMIKAGTLGNIADMKLASTASAWSQTQRLA